MLSDGGEARIDGSVDAMRDLVLASRLHLVQARKKRTMWLSHQDRAPSPLGRSHHRPMRRRGSTSRAQVLTNFLSNAFKFTQSGVKGGVICLDVMVTTLDEFVASGGVVPAEVRRPFFVCRRRVPW